MNILITGCNGLLGQKLCTLAPKGYNIIGIDLQDSSPVLQKNSYIVQDLTDKNETEKLILSLKPAFIINAAAFTNVDAAESNKELVQKINVDLVENLAHGANLINAGIIHVSTDYVFDGYNGPYTETAKPNPLGEYGRSKLAAEILLQQTCKKYAIARTMVLYGFTKTGKPDFVSWLVGQLINEKPVRIVNDQIGNTTLADELAYGLWRLIELDYTGIINIAGREIIDRFSFAIKIAEVFNLKKTLISPVTTAEFNQPAPRPLNSGLIVDKAQNELLIQLSNVVEGLTKYKQQYDKAELK